MSYVARAFGCTNGNGATTPAHRVFNLIIRNSDADSAKGAGGSKVGKLRARLRPCTWTFHANTSYPIDDRHTILQQLFTLNNTRQLTWNVNANMSFTVGVNGADVAIIRLLHVHCGHAFVHRHALTAVDRLRQSCAHNTKYTTRAHLYAKCDKIVVWYTTNARAANDGRKIAGTKLRGMHA
jgi:hypothetical protein